MRRALVTCAVCGLFALGSTTTQGQTPAPGAIIGTGTFTSFVENMDRSLAFYHDVFGMDVPAIPEAGERPYNRANPQLFAMFDIPDAKERHQSARVPGTRLSVEVMEVQNVPHHTVQLRPRIRAMRRSCSSCVISTPRSRVSRKPTFRS